MSSVVKTPTAAAYAIEFTERRQCALAEARNELRIEHFAISQ